MSLPACSEAGGSEQGPALSAAARARAERQRERARALRAARVAPAAVVSEASVGGGGGGKKLIDTGGGFLLEDEPPAPRLAAQPPAPRLQPEPCDLCQRLFDTSYLLDHFELAVCDACRDEEGEHALVARTQAKAEFLLKDCDLDARGGPLPSLARTNPHRAHGAPMRLYVRAQLRERAHLVWGGAAALEAERSRRAERGDKAKAARYSRELRALRLAVRGSTFAQGRGAAHEHAWGPETHDADQDQYSRTCATCGHTQTYEKM